MNGPGKKLNRCHIHDSRPFLDKKTRQEQAGKPGQCYHINHKHPPYSLPVACGEFAVIAKAGVINEDINEERTARDLAMHRFRGIERTQILRDALNCHTILARQRSRDFFKYSYLPRYQNKITAVFGRLFGKRFADAARSAGDEAVGSYEYIVVIP